MKSISKSSALLTLVSLVLFSSLSACEPHLQEVFKASITPQAKNAVDVLPADVSYAGMMNTQDLKSNEYTDLFGPDGLLNNYAPEEGLARLQDFMEATGFDVNEDLQEVYIAAGELSDDQAPEVSMVAYASIDPAELQSYVEENVRGELRVRTYRGIDIFEGKESDTPGFSFVNDDMIIAASSTALLEDMIDRLKGEGTSLSSNAEMMELVTRASAGESGWFIAKKLPEASLGAPDPDDAANDEITQSAVKIWSALDYVVGALNIESNGLDGQIFFYPKTNVSADDLSSLMNGVIAAAKAHPDLDEKGLKMLDDMRATTSGDHVRLGMFVENSMIKTIKG